MPYLIFQDPVENVNICVVPFERDELNETLLDYGIADFKADENLKGDPRDWPDGFYLLIDGEAVTPREITATVLYAMPEKK